VSRRIRQRDHASAPGTRLPAAGCRSARSRRRRQSGVTRVAVRQPPAQRRDHLTSRQATGPSVASCK
jgi:hypothetical protein